MRPASCAASKNFPAAPRTAFRNASTPSPSAAFAYEIRHVEGKKVACRNKRIDRFQADVVGIDVVGSRESKRSYRCVGLGPNVIGFGFDEGMLTIGFVPDRVNINACIARLQDCL